MYKRLFFGKNAIFIENYNTGTVYLHLRKCILGFQTTYTSIIIVHITLYNIQHEISVRITL